MKKIAIYSLLALFLLGLALDVHAGGFLQKIREKVHDEEEEEESSSNNGNHNDHNNNGNHNGHSNHGNHNGHNNSNNSNSNGHRPRRTSGRSVSIFGFFNGGGNSSSSSTSSSQRSPVFPNITTTFSEFPYQNGHPGYMLPEIRNKYTAIRMSFESISTAQGVSSLGGGILFSTAFGLAFQADVRVLDERIEDEPYDRISLSNFNLLFRFVETINMQMRGGIGLRYMSDDYGVEYGTCFAMQADLFPLEPIIVSASMDIGTLGKATMLNGRIQAGMNIRNIEAYAGYSIMQVEDIGLTGPVLGMRTWF